MFDGETPKDVPAGTKRTPNGKPENEIEALHRRCGVYTKPDVVRRILDAVEWQDKADLTKARLLEPGAGDGQFVVEAARRLLASYRRYKRKPTFSALAGRITAYELHREESEIARSRIVTALRELGLHHRTAAACAKAWIINADFLLAETPAEEFTHTVGNPPYVRWSRIPKKLKAAYEQRLSGDMTGGDLFLPFLDRALESLQPGGRCGFLCSDRWRFMAFAEGFRQKWLPRLKIESEKSVIAADAFAKDVDAYPTILIASKRANKVTRTAGSVSRSGKTLKELECVVKVGPALGHTPAFVLQPEERDVEKELLRPWFDGSEINEGTIDWRGRHVVTMYTNEGKLIDLQQYPKLKARLERFDKQLKKRSIVANGAPWYRTIDRVRAVDWDRPKLVVPELAKVPRIAIDRSGAIPSHGVYAIFAPGDDVATLYEKLRDGQLAGALKEIAPKVKGGYVRCYRRFLMMVRIDA